MSKVYQVITDVTPHASEYLLAGVKETVAASLKVPPSSLRFTSLYPEKYTYPSSKFLPGPTPSTKLIGVFRKLEQSNGTISYPYFGLFIINMENREFEFKNLMWKIDQNNNKLRDVIMHPNLSIVTLVYEFKFENYYVKKQKDPNPLAYALKFRSTLPLEQTLMTMDTEYDPSGNYIIGMAYYETEGAFRVFRYDVRTRKIAFSQNLMGKCVAKRNYQFLAKWGIAVDRSRPNKIMVSGNVDGVCLLDLDTMVSVTRSTSNSNPSLLLPMEPDDMTFIELGSGEVVTSVGYLNATKQGYFLGYKPVQRLAHQFTLASNGSFEQSAIFSYVPWDSTKVEQISKCVDITHIDAIACIRQFSNSIHLTKLVQKDRKAFSLGLIGNENNEVIVGMEERTQSTNDEAGAIDVAEDILYHEETGQLCLINSLRMKCRRLFIHCTPNPGDSMQGQPITSCASECQARDPNLYWDPITMSCRNCTLCACTDQALSFSPYYGHCVRDCGKVKQAVAGSEYGTDRSCVCKDPYTWHADIMACRYNCSSLPHADPKADVDKLAYNQCQCVSGYRFLRKLDASDGSVGFCQFVCPDGTMAEDKEGKPWCQCSREAEQWDYKGLKCVYSKGGEGGDATNLKQGLPILAIVLIVIFGVLTLLAIVFLVYRKMKAKRQHQNEEQQGNNQIPTSSDRRTRLQSQNPNRNSQQELTDQKVCAICQLPDANCQTPCGHYFHMFCLREKIDGQDNSKVCPVCAKQLPNGTADVKFVEKEEDGFTISDQ